MQGPPDRARPRLNGILEVALYVADVAEAVRFYTDMLGLQVIETDERLTALGVADRQVLLLCRAGASGSLAKGAHDAQGVQHIAFSIPASEYDPWVERLRARGIALEDERDWGRGGRSLYFRDPDGHLVELVTPGVWSVH